MKLFYLDSEGAAHPLSDGEAFAVGDLAAMLQGQTPKGRMLDAGYATFTPAPSAGIILGWMNGRQSLKIRVEDGSAAGIIEGFVQEFGLPNGMCTIAFSGMPTRA